MKKILVATDGSAPAREAVVFGLELAGEQGAEAIVVHVAPAFDVMPGAAFATPGALPHSPSADDRAALEEASSLAAREGISAQTVLLTGDPVNEIVAYADSINADLIVIGSRGRGAVASAFLGSVSQGVLHEARRPVLIFRRVPARASKTAAAAS